MALGAPRGRLLAAYLTLYVVWGASYLFIRLAVESMPPIPMAAARYALAGVLMVAVATWATGTTPTRSHWRAATITGCALIVSNACVAWAVRRIPSGVAALCVAMTPCWMVLLEWGTEGRRPSRGVVAGLLLGLVGIAVLVEPGQLLGGARIDLAGAGVTVLGTAVWAAGSLYSRRAPRPASAALLSGMQMLAGGALLLLTTVAAGGWEGFALSQVTTRSWIGFWYLVLVASLAGFTAYVYLLEHASAARASTYAYVNPVVAVALGALFAREAVTGRILIAAAAIVGAVALIVTFGAARAPQDAASRSRR